MFFREYQYCKRISVPVDLILIGVSILLIAAGCYVLCFLKPSIHDELIDELLSHPDMVNMPHEHVRASMYASLGIEANGSNPGFESGRTRSDLDDVGANTQNRGSMGANTQKRSSMKKRNSTTGSQIRASGMGHSSSRECGSAVNACLS
jgi:hypothetical protein